MGCLCRARACVRKGDLGDEPQNGTFCRRRRLFGGGIGTLFAARVRACVEGRDGCPFGRDNLLEFLKEILTNCSLPRACVRTREGREEDGITP